MKILLIFDFVNFNSFKHKLIALTSIPEAVESVYDATLKPVHSIEYDHII